MIQINEISVEELDKKLDGKDKFKLIDVREQNEFDIARIEGAELIPLSSFQTEAVKKLKPEDEIVVHCHHGGRSRQACLFLKSMGFNNVTNVTGGIDAWSLQIDPEVTRY